MSELHPFAFEGLRMPVRGALVRLTDDWQEILRRRAANSVTGAWPPAVMQLAGEMTAAVVLMQSAMNFFGMLTLQILGDGPVKEVTVDARPNLLFRATATITGPVTSGPPGAPLSLSSLMNAQGGGQCIITLNPAGRLPSQQPSRSTLPLVDAHGRPLESVAALISHHSHHTYQSTQLNTVLVLAADEHAACGLMVQNLPGPAGENLPQGHAAQEEQDDDFRRITLLAQTLTRQELLTLDADTILHRLFWQERLVRSEPLTGENGPRFVCSCSREAMLTVLRDMGENEVRNLLRQEGGQIEFGCLTCGWQLRFNAVDVARVFTPAQVFASGPPAMQ